MTTSSHTGTAISVIVLLQITLYIKTTCYVRLVSNCLPSLVDDVSSIPEATSVNVSRTGPQAVIRTEKWGDD